MVATDAGRNSERREENTWIAQMSVRVNMPQRAEVQLRKWEWVTLTSGPQSNGSRIGKQPASRKRLTRVLYSMDTYFKGVSLLH